MSDLALSDPRGTIAVEAGGRTVRLRFGTAAMVRYAEATGEAAIAAVRGLEQIETDPAGIRRLRDLYAAALVPPVPADEAAEIIDALGLGEAARLLGRAVTAAFPPAAAGGKAGGAESTPDP